MLHAAIRRVGGLALCLLAVLALGITAAGCEGTAELAAIRKHLSGVKPDGHSLPVLEDYFGGSVGSKDSAWVVGSYGTILHITDDGTKVTLQHSGVTRPLFSATASGPNDCMVSGEDGILLRTTDGGKTWNKISPPKGIDENLLAITRGSNPKDIWAVGPKATLIHSSDDGKTWEDLSLHKDETLNGVWFTDEMDGWVVGEFGVIKHTADGGKTWTEMDKVSDLPPYFQDVTPKQAYLLGVPKLTEEDLYLFQIMWTSPQTGYIASTGGLVLATNDGGQTWQAMRTGSHNSLFAIGAAAGHPAVVTGVLGTLIHQKGNSWKVERDISSRIFTWLRSVEFSPHGSLGIITGGTGTVLVSHDFGATWKEFSKPAIKEAGVKAFAKKKS